MRFTERQARLRERMAAGKVEALVVSHLANARYLTGFTGSNALLLMLPERTLLFTDGRYRQQAATEVQAAQVVIPPKGDLWRAAAIRLAPRGRRTRARVGLEAERVTLAQRQRLVAHAPSLEPRLQPVAGWVEALRAVKDADEIAALRRAIALAESVFPATLRRIRPGARETAVAGYLEYALRRRGGNGLAFDTILVGGARAALVHGHASAAPLPAQGPVVLDYGVNLDGYMSDMTRTVHLGAAGRRARAIYAAVAAAQQAALAVVRPGALAAAVDRAARRVIGRAGYGQYFSHSTGHGVGLEIHEAPRLAATSSDRLEAGQVVTIEPGIYLPGWGGVRIEDMVLVTAQGAELLTSTPRNLIIL